MAKSFVRQANGSNLNDGGSPSFGASVTAGNGLFFGVAWSGVTTTLDGITDSQGNTWTRVRQYQDSTPGSEQTVEIWKAHAQSSAACTLTVDFSATTVAAQWSLVEVSGFTNGVTGDQTNQNRSTGDTTADHGTITPTDDDVFIFAVGRCIGTFTVNTVNDSFTPLTYGTRKLAHYAIQTTAAAVDCDLVFSGNVTFSGIIASFYQTPVIGDPPTVTPVTADETVTTDDTPYVEVDVESDGELSVVVEFKFSNNILHLGNEDNTDEQIIDSYEGGAEDPPDVVFLTVHPQPHPTWLTPDGEHATEDAPGLTLTGDIGGHISAYGIKAGNDASDPYPTGRTMGRIFRTSGTPGDDCVPIDAAASGQSGGVTFTPTQTYLCLTEEIEHDQDMPGTAAWYKHSIVEPTVRPYIEPGETVIGVSYWMPDSADEANRPAFSISAKSEDGTPVVPGRNSYFDGYLADHHGILDEYLPYGRLYVTYQCINKVSDVDGEITDVTDGSSSPFPSGHRIRLQIPAPLLPGQYFWQARAKNPTGSDVFGSWSVLRKMTVNAADAPITGSPVPYYNQRRAA